MNRLVSPALAAALLAASGGAAFAADVAPATANPPAAAARHDNAGPLEARMTRALNLLEAQGYGDFRNFRQDGKNFDASVTRNGRQVTVVVEPDSNKVTQQG